MSDESAPTQVCPPHAFTFDRAIFTGSREERRIFAVCLRCSARVSLDQVITQLMVQTQIQERQLEVMAKFLASEGSTEVDYEVVIQAVKDQMKREMGYVEPVAESADA